MNIVTTTTKALKIMLKNNNKVWKPAFPGGKIYYLLSYNKLIIREYASIEKGSMAWKNRTKKQTSEFIKT